MAEIKLNNNNNQADVSINDNRLDCRFNIKSYISFEELFRLLMDVAQQMNKEGAADKSYVQIMKDVNQLIAKHEKDFIDDMEKLVLTFESIVDAKSVQVHQTIMDELKETVLNEV